MDRGEDGSIPGARELRPVHPLSSRDIENGGHARRGPARSGPHAVARRGNARGLDLRIGPQRWSIPCGCSRAAAGERGMPVVSLHIDGRTIEADENTTVMDAARGAGLQIPYLCACDREGYTPIAACRSCLVEVAGEAALVPACRRKVAQGMAVTTRNDRIDNVRRLVVELTASEMGEVEFAGQTSTTFGRLARSLDVTATRFGFDAVVTQPDTSHPAVVFVADACIRCGLCRVACQDVQEIGIVALAGDRKSTRLNSSHQ